MLPNIEADEIAWVSDDDIEQELAKIGHRKTLGRLGLSSSGHKKRLIAFSLLANRKELHPGYPFLEQRCARKQWRSHRVRCQTAWEIQSAIGCPFDCSYCPYGAFLNVRLDVESIVDRMMAVVEQETRQTLFKLNNRTDTLGLEPEYGLAPLLIEKFASLKDKYLLLYSKGVEVDALLGLNHLRKTVASWTLTPSRVQQIIEPGAPDTASRLRAISLMAENGYPIRVRLSPIVPIRDWEDSYLELIESLKKCATPEMITLWTLSMIDPGDLERIVPLEELQPSIVQSMRQKEAETKGTKGAPFPTAVRIEIYRKTIEMIKQALPSTAVAVCLESPEVWEGLGNLLDDSAESGTSEGGTSEGGFYCNCGPRSTPSRIPRSAHR